MEGYRLIREAGFDTPPRVEAAIEAYRSEADIIGVFLKEYTIRKEACIDKIPITNQTGHIHLA